MDRRVAGGGGGLYNTAAFDIYGLPTITVPCGFSGEGLPVGLGIVGRPFAEATVLRIGSAYEGSTGWGEHTPRAHAGPYL